MITDQDKGWIAGILDFQGHIVKKNNKMRAAGSVQLVLYVETSTTEIIARLCELTGVSVEMHHDKDTLKPEWTRRSCTEHCPEAHVHIPAAVVNMPVQGRWTVTGAALAVVLWNVRDFMVTADEPWDRALATAIGGTRLSGQGSGQVLSALRRLSGLGWGLPPVFGDVPQKLEATG